MGDSFARYERGRTEQFVGGVIQLSGLPSGSGLNSFLATRGTSRSQHRNDFREDCANAKRDARHQGSSANGHKTRHQSVLDEILTVCIRQGP